jgi:hypothetical protein
MDPSRFRRICFGLHRLSPRQVGELGIRLAGVGARTETLVGLDARAGAMRACPRCGAGRIASPRGVPRGGARHDLRRPPGVVPSARRTAQARQDHGLALADAHPRRAGAGDGGVLEADQTTRRESRKGSREWVRHAREPQAYPTPPRPT